MDMDVDNLETAFLKSWGEVLRRNDPFLWSLALETSSALPTSPSPSSPSSSLSTPVHTNGLHSSATYTPSDPNHRMLLSQAPLSSQSSSTTLRVKESSSKLAPQAHRRQSFCQSLLNPHEAHALDWLKCLILTEDYSVNASEKKSHLVLSLAKNHPLGATQTQDFGPVGQVISRRAGTVHANPSAPISSSGSTSSTSAGNNTPSAAASSTTSTTTSTTSTIAGGALSEAVHVGIGAGYRPRQQMTGSGTLDSSVQPSSAVSDSAAKVPLTPGAVHASDAVAATAAVSDATHTREASLTNVNPATPSPHQPTTVVPISGSGSISSNASVTSSPTTNSTTTATAEATATSTTPSSNSATGPTPVPTTTATANTENSASTSHTKTLPFLPSFTTPIVLPALETVIPMAQRQLIRSKDATVAFFYRTFSPTYRISRLYIDSWSNGGQKRGLNRIQKAFVEGHAFTLVKGATLHMKDVWRQVAEAYKIKSANARAEKARRISKSAKGKK
ncbi:hypothetical protein EMPS_08346 [Entomortierella parvispora]|uniref:Uncharacterized protein n=1 Tax=Entomortierella parvispora TaxID=205924 RepID=A0A9P3HG67_9FUNG|nr:hypothetical protein EMPS_08346 [Entomortierella parvispora]